LVTVPDGAVGVGVGLGLGLGLGLGDSDADRGPHDDVELRPGLRLLGLVRFGLGLVGLRILRFGPRRRRRLTIRRTADPGTATRALPGR
jgi:hypothetical protein